MAGPDVAVPAPPSPRTIRWTLLGVMLSMLLGLLGHDRWHRDVESSDCSSARGDVRDVLHTVWRQLG
jgi:hypothetical protein